MEGFKLIAIVPLPGCHVKFTKNLLIGEVYKFYQEYDILYNQNENTFEYFENVESLKQVNLFELKNGINLNISAVVGLNGSGKSSLIELLYYFIYNIATSQKAYGRVPIEKYSNILQNQHKIHSQYFEKLKNENSIINAVAIQNRLGLKIQNMSNDELEKLTEEDYINTISNLIFNKAKYLYNERQDALRLEQIIDTQLNVGIVYQSKDGLFSLISKGKELSFQCIKNYTSKEISSEFNYENFFYSVSLNFSLHSLNSKTIGSWINSLFHKNDAYTTPVVINPMRTDGNFKINHEINLNNERLMSSIAYMISKTGKAKLIDKYDVDKIVFTAKKGIIPVFCKGLEQRSDELRNNNKHFFIGNDKISRILDEKEYYNLFSVKLILKFLNIEKIKYDIPFLNYAVGYLENKIPKLKDTYPQFFSSTGDIVEKEFNFFLKEDKSHITKKIRQTLVFIKTIYENDNTIWESPSSYLANYVEIESFKNWLKDNDEEYQKLSSSKLLEFAFPGFFSVDYHLQTIDKKTIKLSDLSSGEQQMLFNINTIIYHLLNLQSICIEKSNKFNRIQYKNISIILDEMELYYHPDMQRKLVKNILDSLEIIKNKDEKGLESINICFLTHSPFILSDIPKSNIMHLMLDKNGKAIVTNREEETFGANIHDLLANDFFLNEGFMGEFAKTKINEVIKSINYHSNEIEIKKLQTKKDNLVKLETYENSKLTYLKDYNLKIRKELNDHVMSKAEIKKLADIIGEPLIKDKIIQMLKSI